MGPLSSLMPRAFINKTFGHICIIYVHAIRCSCCKWINSIFQRNSSDPFSPTLKYISISIKHSANNISPFSSPGAKFIIHVSKDQKPAKSLYNGGFIKTPICKSLYNWSLETLSARMYGMLITTCALDHLIIPNRNCPL